MKHGANVLVLLVLLAASSGVQSAPIVGASANTIPEGTFMVDGWFLVRDFTWAYENSSESWTTLPGNTSETATTFMPRLYYGLNDWLTLRLGVPIEDRYRDRPEYDDSRSSTGFGDLIFDPKIRVYESEDGDTRAALLMGVRVPTGDTEADIALSDGSTDVMIGAVATHNSGGASGHVCVTHWLNGENEWGFDVPDLWVGTLTLEVPIDESWKLLWEAKGYAGSEDATYRRIYACPGISWSGERTTVGVSALVSAYRDGDTAVSPYDFDWAPCLRVYYRFF